MCLAIPMQVKQLEGDLALVQSGGFLRKIHRGLLVGLKTGDYVLVHAGFAIEKIDPKKAKETLRLLDEIR